MEVTAALPPGFEYIERSLGLESEDLEPAVSGCDCDAECGVESGCACCKRNPLGQLYDDQGRLKLLVHRTEADDTIFECSPACSCGLRCRNAVTQRPSGAELRLAELPGKGLGVFSSHGIAAGTFICSYVGEYVTTVAAQQRLQQYDAEGNGHALLVVREVLPSGGTCLRVNIDATRKGNLARFFNHSCDGGNLAFVMVRHAGALLPRVAFFARRDIPPGQELTFAYGPPNSGPQGKRCCCGTASCRGFLPHEEV